MIPRSSALRASFAGLVGLGWAGQAFLHLQSGLITWDGGGIRRTGRLGMEPELWGALFFWFAAVSTVCAAGALVFAWRQRATGPRRVLVFLLGMPTLAVLLLVLRSPSPYPADVPHARAIAGTIAAFQLAYLVVITAFGARRPH